MSQIFTRSKLLIYVIANVHTYGTLLWSSGGGDLDLNGVIDNIDMGILFDMIGTEALHGIGDMDANGVIDSSDRGLLLLKIE